MSDVLDAYQYDVPDELVARVPASPRDSARMLVYRKKDGSIIDTTFEHLAEFLPPKTVLIFNDTKVIPARMYAKREDGEDIEIFVTSIGQDTHARILSNRNMREGDLLTIADETKIHVVHKEGKETSVALQSEHSWSDVLARYGETPIPPYLRDTPLTEAQLRTEYQTIFAHHEGSVAAPTASLHFTDSLMRKIEMAGIAHTFVTLHVNLGTFAPVGREALDTNTLHKEWFRIPRESAEVIQNAMREGVTIIPVGTTALRALESAAAYIQGNPELDDYVGTTQLFIRPPYSFKIAHGLITNFHVPKSSLMMLVASMIGREKLLELYAHALHEQYRFFSFGDGMLILP